jgi:hypothetical protein
MDNELKFSTEKFDYLELEILINSTWGKRTCPGSTLMMP